VFDDMKINSEVVWFWPIPTGAKSSTLH